MASPPFNNPYALLALFLSPCKEGETLRALHKAIQQGKIDWGSLLYQANLHFCTPLWYVRLRQGFASGSGRLDKTPDGATFQSKERFPDKAKPSARRGRKAADLRKKMAELPKDESDSSGSSAFVFLRRAECDLGRGRSER